MSNKIIVQAQSVDRLFTSLTEWKNQQGNKKLNFLYDPRENGWRYRIILFLNNAVTHVLHGDLESVHRNRKNPLILLKEIMTSSEIESYYCQYPNDCWPLTGESFSIDEISPVCIPCAQNNKIIIDFARNRKEILKNFIKARPSLSSNIKSYIFSRSMGCCEFEYCAEPLLKGKEGKYGYYGYFAHIIGASANGPRSEKIISQDELTDPQNFLLLCDKHHRLIDQTDPEFYDKNRLRQMLEIRIKQRELLVTQLKYEKVNSLAILSDIAGVSVGISSDEALKAMLAHGLQPFTETIAQRYLGDQKNGHELLRSKSDSYWENFLYAFEQEIRLLGNFVTNDSEQAARYHKLAIFPLGNMPTMFLAGYIVGEIRPIALFHRDRNRDGGTWCWDQAESKTNFSWSHNSVSDKSDIKAALLTLEITATLTSQLIPKDIQNLPRISIIAEKPQQNPFGSIQDFNKLKEILQDAINYAQDTLKVEYIHIICIAPAVTVFALGQKFQRRNSAKLHIYQTGKDNAYYPVFDFNRQEVFISNNPKIRITL